MAHPEGHGDQTAAIWLFLLKGGGRWTSGEIARGIAGDTDGVSQLLSAMAQSGQVRKHPVVGKERRFAYGVTGDCKVPRAVTVRAIADCVLAAAPDAEVPA
jgi:hypothetical protein